MGREVFSLRADRATARCPLCKSPVMGVQGVEEYTMFPAQPVTADLFQDPYELTWQQYPPPVVSQFRATFAPCGCVWEGADRNGPLPYLLLIEADDNGVHRFSVIERDPRYTTYRMYIMQHTERTHDGQD